MKKFVLFLCSIFIVSSVASYGAELGEPKMPLPLSLEKEAQHAIHIGVQWLENQQKEEGYWSNPVFPAITGLAVSAILNSPEVIQNGTHAQSVEKGLEFILSCMQPDGCIYKDIEGRKGGGLPNYNTAVCLMALADADKPGYELIIDRARQCLIDHQYLGPGVFHGGMGYDAEKNRPYADLSNTVLALEALWRTQPAKDSGAQNAELDWEAAIEFVSRCQHLRQSNDQPWVSESVEQRGGFVYHPSESKAGEIESDDDDPGVLRSYGSMTYAGLLSFIYADVDRDDPRVQAASEWIIRHWTLEENPGMGQQGLYYNYFTLAKALNALGRERLLLAGGREMLWRRELVRKLVSLQRIDSETGFGYWQNDNNRWWENDPNLVTAYTLLALEVALYGVTPAVPE